MEKDVEQGGLLWIHTGRAEQGNGGSREHSRPHGEEFMEYWVQLPHFTWEEMETQGGRVTGPRSQPQQGLRS